MVHMTFVFKKDGSEQIYVQAAEKVWLLLAVRPCENFTSQI